MNKLLNLLLMSGFFMASLFAVENRLMVKNSDKNERSRFKIEIKDAQGNIFTDYVEGKRDISFTVVGVKPWFDSLYYIDSITLSKTDKAGNTITNNLNKNQINKLNNFLKKERGALAGLAGVEVPEDITKAEVKEKLLPYKGGIIFKVPKKDNIEEDWTKI